MTDTIVPDTTATSTSPGLRMFVSSVVRLKEPRLHHREGTRAVIVSTRDEGRYQFELLVPGYPIKFWVQPGDVEILTAPDQDWWKLLTAND